MYILYETYCMHKVIFRSLSPLCDMYELKSVCYYFSRDCVTPANSPETQVYSKFSPSLFVTLQINQIKLKFFFLSVSSMDNPDNEIVLYLMLRAVDRFHKQHGRYPGKNSN